MSIGHCGNGYDPVRVVKYGLQTCREVRCVCALYGVCAPWWRRLLNAVVRLSR